MCGICVYLERCRYDKNHFSVISVCDISALHICVYTYIPPDVRNHLNIIEVFAISTLHISTLHIYIYINIYKYTPYSQVQSLIFPFNICVA